MLGLSGVVVEGELEDEGEFALCRITGLAPESGRSVWEEELLAASYGL